ncbi:Uncharacterised protein [Mycobacteroides abscessus subsp. massiliense]|uniref:hypothetical protein n=1 Tax=Mycobacteroides abscessus TaxID=36809 RepID=UPI00092678F2|nr:hypothetical protein [Mycobacteroides abscessus]SHX44183.1 Uncharacterised protein [Mycobacteroides abscessus subsp. abscessus]SKM67038.1 Uncharacterised protein [Mycobacteroides abscessus subsp. massiliense]SKN33496.1 Uncharacterised protein [Mycobacteroides abscessus subsp. massiliense]SKP15380.1 Uncharacterised protein [Mycobacteroides abscessus subsp. massiliense]SKP58583.1 Uncharacterised protein [Mycobacteroides abscessus subsp. massiliense]
MKELRVYGCSDDLVEFEGAFDEEYGAYGVRAQFLVIARSDYLNARQLWITAEYGEREWELCASAFSGECDLKWNIRLDRRTGTGRDTDPCLFIEIDDDETVTVMRLDKDGEY